MKTIDAHILEAVQNAQKAGHPHSYLLQIEVAPDPTDSLFLTSRALNVQNLDVELYNWVLDWGELTEAVAGNARVSATGDISLKLTGQFWRLDAAFDLLNKDAKLYRIYGNDVYLQSGWGGPWGLTWGLLGGTQGEIAAELVFHGAIRNIQGTADEVELTIEDFSSRFNQSYPDVLLLKDDTFWSLPKESIGKPWPTVFGEIGLNTGGLWTPPKAFETPRSTLASTITDSDTEITLNDNILAGSIAGMWEAGSDPTAYDLLHAELVNTLEADHSAAVVRVLTGKMPGRAYFRIEDEYLYSRQITDNHDGTFTLEQLERGLFFSIPWRHDAGTPADVTIFMQIEDEIISFHDYKRSEKKLCKVNRGGSLGSVPQAHEAGVEARLINCPEYWAVTNAGGREPNSADIQGAYCIFSDGTLSAIDSGDYDYGPTTADLKKSIFLTKTPPIQRNPSKKNTKRARINLLNEGGATTHPNFHDQDLLSCETLTIPAGSDYRIDKQRTSGFKAYGKIKQVFIKIKYCKHDDIQAGFSYHTDTTSNDGVNHDLSDTGDEPVIAEFDITEERNMRVEDWDWLTDFAGEMRIPIHNNGSVSRTVDLYEAWFEVEYYYDEEWTLGLDLKGVKEYSLDNTRQVITNPADVLWYICREVIDTKYLDHESFQWAYRLYAQNNITFNVAIDERKELFRLLGELAWQCQASFAWEAGRLKLIPRFHLDALSPSEADSALLSFDNSDMADKRYGWRPLSSLINDITLYWQKQYLQNAEYLRLPSGEKLRLVTQVLTSEGDNDLLDSRERYREKLAVELDCYALRDETSVEALYAMLAEHDELKRTLRFRTGLKALPLERYDYVTVTDPDFPSVDGRGCSGKLFYVMETRKVGLYEIEISAVEA